MLLRCIRADGSIASQRNDGSGGRFFAVHDLRHLAVESVLGCDEGFYGLLAAGWEIIDTTGKGARLELPEEAIAVEHLVGMLDADSTNGNASSAAELNEYASAFAKQNQRAASLILTEQNLTDIRGLISTLHSRWMALTEGESLKLSFPLELAAFR